MKAAGASVAVAAEAAAAAMAAAEAAVMLSVVASVMPPPLLLLQLSLPLLPPSSQLSSYEDKIRRNFLIKKADEIMKAVEKVGEAAEAATSSSGNTQ